MSNEITMTGTFTVSPSGVNKFERDVSVAADQTGAKKVENQVSVATSATAIPLGSVTSPGWAWFKNMDATNFLVIHDGATKAGHTIARLYPGKEFVVPLDPTCVPYATADTGACLLDYCIAQQ